MIQSNERSCNWALHAIKSISLRLCVLAVLLPTAFFPQQPARDFSKEIARPSQDWIKDAVIYEIFPRQYSATGDFNGIASDLDRLKTLGVDVLWLMPIHPIGQAKKKGTIGSPYAVKDYYGINPDYGTAADLKRLVAESHPDPDAPRQVGVPGGGRGSRAAVGAARTEAGGSGR